MRLENTSRQSALEDSNLVVNEGTLQGHSPAQGLERIVQEFRSVMKTLKRLARLYPAGIGWSIFILSPAAFDTG